MALGPPAMVSRVRLTRPEAETHGPPALRFEERGSHLLPVTLVTVLHCGDPKGPSPPLRSGWWQ